MIKTLLATTTLTIGISAFAETYLYNCYSYYWNGDTNEKGTMSLVVDGDIASADIAGESWDHNLGGQLNPKYKSKGAIKFLKFGNNLILEEALVNGGKALRDGGLGGIARVEGQAEGGFYQYKFICKRFESIETAKQFSYLENIYEAEAICLKRGTGGRWGDSYYGRHYDAYRAERIALSNCQPNCDGSCRIIAVRR